MKNAVLGGEEDKANVRVVEVLRDEMLEEVCFSGSGLADNVAVAEAVAQRQGKERVRWGMVEARGSREGLPDDRMVLLSGELGAGNGCSIFLQGRGRRGSISPSMLEVFERRRVEVVGHEGQAFENDAGVVGFRYEVGTGVGGEEIGVLVLFAGNACAEWLG